MGVFAEELMKLRVRVGDVYTESGTALTTANVHNTDGTLLTASSLINIYNNAINEYLGYMTTVKPKSMWSTLAPGYVVILTNQSVSSGKVNLDGLTPVPYRIIDIMKYGGTTADDLFIEVPPNEYFADKVGLTKTRAKSNKFTLANDGTNWVALISTPSEVSAIDIIFLKRHTDLPSTTTTEFDKFFPASSLKTVLIFAEIEARRSLSQDIKDSAEARLKMVMDMDAIENQKGN